MLLVLLAMGLFLVGPLGLTVLTCSDCTSGQIVLRRLSEESCVGDDNLGFGIGLGAAIQVSLVGIACIAYALLCRDESTLVISPQQQLHDATVKAQAAKETMDALQRQHDTERSRDQHEIQR